MLRLKKLLSASSESIREFPLLNPTQEPTRADEPMEVETLIPYDEDHYTYILGPTCTTSSQFNMLIDHFIYSKGFELLIMAKWFSISKRPKELQGWPKPQEPYVN